MVLTSNVFGVGQLIKVYRKTQKNPNLWHIKGTYAGMEDGKVKLLNAHFRATPEETIPVYYSDPTLYTFTRNTDVTIGGRRQWKTRKASASSSKKGGKRTQYSRRRKDRKRI